MTKLTKLHDYLMPHPLDRVGQQEAFEAVLEWYEGPNQYMILSAPTGIGKTGIVAKMTQYARVMALARTKVLLDSVYGYYGFKQLQGKRNHPCLKSPETHRADVCSLPDSMTLDERYEYCQGSGNCSYYVQYDKFCQSYKAVTTYAKFVSDRRQYNSPTLYVFDEAHETPETVIERSGVNVNVHNQNRYPYLKDFGDLSDCDDLGFEAGIRTMRRMYATAMKNAPKQIKTWSDMTTDEQIRLKREMIRHRQFLKRIEESGKLMNKSEDDGVNIWHYSSTHGGDFSARPMTAAHHFKNILDTGHHKTLLMSATITPFIAEMLGIGEDEYTFYEAPQQFPVSMRTIWDLGIDSMSHKATTENPVLFKIQAIKIGRVLDTRPDVSSVILTTSKVKANRLADNLRRAGRDVFIPPIGYGTDLQLKAWEDYRKPGAVCVSYNFWEGVSLDMDHMLFLAGIKYPDVSTAFEKARVNRSWNEFYYRGGVQLVQGSGRIQRGNLSDYLPVGNKQVFIAFGNYTRVANAAPGDFKERIKPYPW